MHDIYIYIAVNGAYYRPRVSLRLEQTVHFRAASDIASLRDIQLLSLKVMIQCDRMGVQLAGGVDSFYLATSANPLLEIALRKDSMRESSSSSVGFLHSVV